MLAAPHPFRRVVGVELWEDLHRIALENLASFRESNDCAAEVTSLRMDAADFPLPDEPLVLYFFNPFPEAVLTRVLSNLGDSLARAPRRGYVLFYRPLRRWAPGGGPGVQDLPRKLNLSSGRRRGGCWSPGRSRREPPPRRGARRPPPPP